MGRPPAVTREGSRARGLRAGLGAGPGRRARLGKAGPLPRPLGRDVASSFPSASAQLALWLCHRTCPGARGALATRPERTPHLGVICPGRGLAPGASGSPQAPRAGLARWA